jgi:hypothetical protein
MDCRLSFSRPQFAVLNQTADPFHLFRRCPFGFTRPAATDIRSNMIEHVSKIKIVDCERRLAF